MWEMVRLKAIPEGDDFHRMLGRVHGDFVHQRRVRVLADRIAGLLPENASVLDIGCGDGLISGLVMAERPDVHVQGVDVLVRPNTRIPVEKFDGQSVPRSDGSFDVVMLLDVLHHTDHPMNLLAEAARLARRHVLVKDHDGGGFLARPTLRLMDWIGNARHKVHLPYNYWTGRRWQTAFRDLGLVPQSHQTALGLYPAAVNWIFGRELHFLTLLDKDAVPAWVPAQAA